MYHEVLPRGAAHADSTRYYAVTAETFSRQLDMIRERGFAGCSIAQALRGEGAPRVAISFDDGTLGQYQHALPVLIERNMTATFFVTTSWVGRPGYCTWEHLREMKASGMAVQSHTHTHPFLSELDAGALQDELRRSKEQLDQALEQDTDSLALPGGDAPRTSLRHLLRDAGYRLIATSRWGANADGRAEQQPGALRFLRRCTVQGTPTPSRFAAMLRAEPLLAARVRARETVLAAVRRSLGPSRYARWRRRLLATLDA